MHPLVVAYGALLLAVVFETTGTSFLKQSEQFTRLWPTVITLVSYACSFYLLSVTLRTLPVAIAYAIWCALGIVLISLIGVFVFKQSLDLAACIGLGLIVAGVVVVNAFSNAVSH